MKYFVVFFIVTTLLTSIILAFGYDLGIFKPSFKAGDCIYRTEDGEDFKDNRYEYLVLQVGKSHYNMAMFFSSSKYISYFAKSNEMLSVDYRFKRFECPAFLKESRR